VVGLRNLDLTKSGEDVKAIGACLKTQYNTANVIFELPNMLKEYLENQAKIKEKLISMKKSQETGFIADEPERRPS
jgi:hypothetical protein